MDLTLKICALSKQKPSCHFDEAPPAATKRKLGGAIF
jgi:hypothetical protein